MAKANSGIESEVVVKIAKSVVKAFPNVDCEELSYEAAQAVAVDFGYLKANRGRVGGVSVTEKGLGFAGVDVEGYNKKVSEEKERARLQRQITNLQNKLNGASSLVATTTPVPTTEESATA